MDLRSSRNVSSIMRRRLLYHLNCKTKQLHGGTMTISVEKCWTAKESSKLEEMRSRSLKL